MADIARILRRLGAGVIDAVWRLGYSSRFVATVVRDSSMAFRRFSLTMREIYFAGVLSLVIVSVSGLFVGMVLALQGFETLENFGAADAVGVLVATSLVKELGPVVAGLLFASRAGSAITAEIGLMKTTEQLSAMEMMAVNPIARVVAPRFWAGVISMPMLAAIFSVMGVFGGWIVAVKLLGVDNGTFWSQMQAQIDFRLGIVNGIIKSAVFGVAIAAIAVFEGYDAPRPPKVSRPPRRGPLSSPRSPCWHWTSS
jgi:phospholipid/cholesterol/gamma-HCH transport system permease protein